MPNSQVYLHEVQCEKGIGIPKPRFSSFPGLGIQARRTGIGL